mgnify:CR=1 FL=1
MERQVMTVAEVEAKIAELDRQEAELQAGVERAQEQEAAQVEKLGAALVAGDTKAVTEFQKTVTSFRTAIDALLTRLAALRGQRPILEADLAAARRREAESQAHTLADSLTPEWLKLQEALNTAAAAWGAIRAGEVNSNQLAAPYRDFPRLWQCYPGTTLEELCGKLDHAAAAINRELDRRLQPQG